MVIGHQLVMAIDVVAVWLLHLVMLLGYSRWCSVIELHHTTTALKPILAALVSFRVEKVSVEAMTLAKVLGS